MHGQVFVFGVRLNYTVKAGIKSVVYNQAPSLLNLFMLNLTEHERGTCIKGLFWPFMELKTENCFS